MEPIIRLMRLEDFPQVYNLGLQCYHILDTPTTSGRLSKLLIILRHSHSFAMLPMLMERLSALYLGADS